MLNNYGETLEKCQKLEDYGDFMDTCKKVQNVLKDKMKELHEKKFGEGNRIAAERKKTEAEERKKQEEGNE